MAITHRHQNVRAKKRQGMIDALPPTKFPVVINPHVFDPSTVTGDRTCLQCGQPKSYRLHISRHAFSHNSDSKLGKCICGLSFGNSIHIVEAPYKTN